MMHTARYNCSASSTRATACGKVSFDSPSNLPARALTLSSRPSAPPITKAGDTPSAIQPESQLASSRVVTLRAALVEHHRHAAGRQGRQDALSLQLARPCAVFPRHAMPRPDLAQHQRQVGRHAAA